MRAGNDNVRSGVRNPDSDRDARGGEARSSSRALPREMAYHYAGKVHVRGLLRRVWRPRYLALGDDGYLRYHESVPPLFQQGPQHGQPHNPYSLSMAHSSHHTHRPKTILAILDGARTIDPYTVMDRHVALPQGVHGFVFRGRPVELYTTDPSAKKERAAIVDGSVTEQGALIVPAGAHDKKSRESMLTTSSGHAGKQPNKATAVANLVFPKGTSRRKTAQKIAKKALNPDVLCGGGAGRANICEGGISRSSSSSSLMGYEQPVTGEDSGHDEFGNELHSNHEWGGDSHESHNTLGSFQEVGGSQVCRDLEDNAPRHTIERKEKGQNTHTKSLQVQVQAVQVQSREYLCAVSTAEEAESWVVALGWAAEHRRRIRHENSNRADESIASATTPGAPYQNTTPPMRNSGRREQITVGSAHSHTVNDSESQKVESSKRSSSTSEENSSRESSTHRGVGGDSKASLTSLLLEQEGWCKDPLFTDEPLTPSESGNLTGGKTMSSSQKDLPSTPTPTLPKKHPSSPSHATIVVTKVSKFHLPKDAWMGWNRRDSTDTNIPWFPFHFPLPGDDLALVLQYEIHLLLLRNCKPRNETSMHPESIEQRTVSKTMPEVLSLVRDLMEEFDQIQHAQESGECNQITPTRMGRARPPLQQSDDTFHLLEDVELKLLSCLNSGIKNHSANQEGTSVGPVAELSSAVSDAFATVGIIDNEMRKLSKDRNICSSHHFHEFLGLHPTHNNSASFKVSRDADAEQIVRNWLSKTDHPSTRSKAELTVAVVLRHKLGGPILSLAAVWSTSRLVSLVWCMIAGKRIFISIPIETYTALIALSFFFGHSIGAFSYPRQERSEFELKKRTRDSLEKQPSEALRITTPTSIGTPKDGAFAEETISTAEDDHSTVAEEGGSESEEDMFIAESVTLSSPLPLYPANQGISCWSNPNHKIFMVRGASYLEDRIKAPSAPAIFKCRGVDMWITDNAERNIARHPSVLGGQLDREDTFVVNFLLPFANFVAYFTIPPIEEMPANIADVWLRFIRGDQQYRDGKLKLLPVVVDGPWIVKKAVGPGTSPAVIGRDLPLQYYFSEPTATKKGVYEVDVLVTASRIARGILNVVKGHTKSLTIAFAFIIEASEEAQLPETVLCAFQVHSLHLEDCPNLPDCYPDG